jgi:protein-L-isoaspartate(D-aspartate) O-methyltransferase
MMSPGVFVLSALVFGACTTGECNDRLARPLPTDTKPLDPPANGSAPTASASARSKSGRPAAFAERVAEREELARTVESAGVRDRAVLTAIRTVPRHAFVLPVFRVMAYEDRPMPIVGGQTISQPTVVAKMTEAAKPKSTSKCLEIGTGSGYQAAVLAEICKKTFSIEYLPEVARFGAEHLRALGYGPDRVSLRVGDGYAGWPEAAPFDVILVTAAPEKVPEPLLEQLAVGGRLVIPVGEKNGIQELELWTRVGEGKGEQAFSREVLESVRFVPFVH